MKNNDNKIAHLQMIQEVISRMASNTFLIKGWSITAIGAIFAFWIKERIYTTLFLTLGLIIFFWFHDAYYLYLERGFRNYYDEVRKKEEDKIDFLIKPKFRERLICTMRRPILAYSYGSLLLINLLLLYLYR